jgi:hypothetical protein
VAQALLGLVSGLGNGGAPSARKLAAGASRSGAAPLSSVAELAGPPPDTQRREAVRRDRQERPKCRLPRGNICGTCPSMPCVSSAGRRRFARPASQPPHRPVYEKSFDPPILPPILHGARQNTISVNDLRESFMKPFGVSDGKGVLLRCPQISHRNALKSLKCA